MLRAAPSQGSDPGRSGKSWRRGTCSPPSPENLPGDPKGVKRSAGQRGSCSASDTGMRGPGRQEWSRAAVTAGTRHG